MGTPRHFREIAVGAGAGALAWASYGLAESVFLVAGNRLREPGFAYHPPHPALTALLFVVYPLLGAVAGAVVAALFHLFAGALSPADEARRQRLCDLAALPLPFAVALAVVGGANGELRLRISLGVAGACLFAAVAWLRNPASPRMAWLTGALSRPATISALLVGLPWAIETAGEAPARIVAAAVGYPALVFTLALAIDRTRRRWLGRAQASRHLPSWPRAAALAGGMLLMLALNAEWRQSVHATAPPRESGPPRAGAPDVILISMDTVRADHLSLYGYARPTTPTLERLAARATLYRNAMATAPMTLDSHASMFTGLFSSRHGAHYDLELCPGGCPLDAARPTLAGVLAAAGYRTSGVVANYAFLDHGHGLDRGFERYDERAPRAWLGRTAPYSLRQTVRGVLAPHFPAESSERTYRSAADISASAAEELERLGGDPRPFFLFVNFMDAHAPYAPPAPFDALFPGRDARFRAADYLSLEREVSSLVRPIRPRERDHLLAQYDGAIAYIDSEIGRLWSKLEATGRFENALFIVTSDHGEAFGERDLVGHQSSVYADQVHVPLLVKLPRQLEPRVVDRRVSLADIFPTALELTGMRGPRSLDGVSLLSSPAAPRLAVISESYPNYYLTRWHPRFHRVLRAIYSGSFKLIVSTRGERELYDLAADPAEERSLRDDDHAAMSRELEKRLDLWLSALPAADGDRHLLDRATEESLRALGYL